jgi:hypothetical protein
MATSLTDDAHEDWVELRAKQHGATALTRPESLWTLFGLALLGAVLSFVALIRI